MLLTSAVWNDIDGRSRLVIALFDGSWRESTPDFLSAFPYLDLRPTKATFEANYVWLRLQLTGRTKEAPLIGQPPANLDPPAADPLYGIQRHRTEISKLPPTDSTLIGRDPQLALLDQAWANPATNLTQIIAPGGTGKTALMTKWYKRHLAEATVFGWSFWIGTRWCGSTSGRAWRRQV